MSSPHHVLLVEDDLATTRFVGASLAAANCVVDHAADGFAGLNLARGGDYDCLVLDRNLPGIDGLSLLHELRDAKCAAPVLILSALGSTDERVRGLNGGADDYLVKPFASAELVARVQSLMRRHMRRPETHAQLSFADLQLDLARGQASRAGRPLTLSPRAMQLLAFFLQHKGKAVTRRMILEQVWHYDFDPGTNVIDVHVSNLRKVIDLPGLPRLLHTVRGVGYRLG